MKIGIIGASKGVGFATLKRALERGHEVYALARTDIPMEKAYLHTFEGSATNKEMLKGIVLQVDVVLITLGQGRSFKATTLMEDIAHLLLSIHAEEKFEKPVLILSGFGAGDSIEYNKRIPKMVFKTLLKKVYDDKNRMEQLISSSTLNWMIVRPGMLTNGRLTEKYRVETHLFKEINIGKISRADVADFMVKQAEKWEYNQTFVSLTQ